MSIIYDFENKLLVKQLRLEGWGRCKHFLNAHFVLLVAYADLLFFVDAFLCWYRFFSMLLNNGKDQIIYRYFEKLAFK